MNIEIEYCVPCGYLDRAIDAQRRILEEFGNRLGGVTLKPGDRGVFTFRADDEVLYSKPAEYDIEDIVAAVASHVGPAASIGVAAEGRDLLMGKKQ